MRGSHAIMIKFEPNPPGETRVWLSTSIRESLPNAENVIFFSFYYVSLTQGMKKKVLFC